MPSPTGEVPTPAGTNIDSAWLADGAGMRADEVAKAKVWPVLSPPVPRPKYPLHPVGDGDAQEVEGLFQLGQRGRRQRQA